MRRLVLLSPLELSAMPVTLPAGETFVERFRRGDENAFTEMYDRYSRGVFAAAMSILGNRELAADAVQETFVKVWQALGSFDATRDLEPWLFTITRRTAVDVYRRTRRASSATPLDTAVESRLAVLPVSLERHWLTWQVRQALTRLTTQEQEVLRLAYYHEMTQSEIGRELGIPVGTVKSRTYRALRRLGELLPHMSDSSAEAVSA
ncbi:sigma-70 family RNA polymerase sigma factor [Sphaerisporangium sp. B11E5]|uniref:RNA polymerase sigma factor n=1 Tax=Sphaerisporangium sp. B11E5 TaxID=3153563 RepID=UPI00325CF357